MTNTIANLTRLRDYSLPPPIVVQPDTTILEAARRLRAANVSSLLVGEPGSLISIVTERDVVDAFARDQSPDVPVISVSVANPLSIGDDATLGEAGQRMVENGVRHLVVTAGEQAVAVVSMRDVVAALLSTNTAAGTFAVLCGAVASRPEFWLG
jgi:CBS domain-containing protein